MTDEIDPELEPEAAYEFDRQMRKADLEESNSTGDIRELNDAFRTSTESVAVGLAVGELFVTKCVATRGDDFVRRALEAVRSYTDFNEDNDPYGEHDFGAFELDGEKLFWKIDYYDHELEWRSPDPADPELTRRVLTVLLAEEY